MCIILSACILSLNNNIWLTSDQTLGVMPRVPLYCGAMEAGGRFPPKARCDQFWNTVKANLQPVVGAEDVIIYQAQMKGKSRLFTSSPSIFGPRLYPRGAAPLVRSVRSWKDAPMMEFYKVQLAALQRVTESRFRSGLKLNEIVLAIISKSIA